MGKSLGITAFVLLIISLPIPVFGNYITLLGILILSLAAYQGEKQWVIITDIIAWVKMFFLSPTWHALMFGSSYMRDIRNEMNRFGPIDDASLKGMNAEISRMGDLNVSILFITLAILAAPLVIMVARSRVPGTRTGKVNDD